MNRGQPLPSIPTWKLKHAKADLEVLAQSEAMFNRGYRMQAIDPKELKFPSWALNRQTGVVLSDTWRRQLPAYVGVDLAGDKRPGNAIVVVGLEEVTHRRHLLEVKAGAWNSPQTAAVLAEVCSHHNVRFIQVENNAYQQAIIDWVRKEKPDFPYWMKIEAFTTGKNKADPQYGLPGLEVEFKNGAWVIPYSEYEGHPSTCPCDWCRLDREVSLYPKGSSTDILMALWMARDAIVKWAPRRVTGGRGLRGLNTR